MKSYKEFISEADYRAPVNTRQMFSMDSKTQENLNKARPQGPGSKAQKPIKFTLEPTNIPMK